MHLFHACFSCWAFMAWLVLAAPALSQEVELTLQSAERNVDFVSPIYLQFDIKNVGDEPYTFVRPTLDYTNFRMEASARDGDVANILFIDRGYGYGLIGGPDATVTLQPGWTARYYLLRSSAHYQQWEPDFWRRIQEIGYFDLSAVYRPKRAKDANLQATYTLAAKCELRTASISRNDQKRLDELFSEKGRQAVSLYMLGELGPSTSLDRLHSFRGTFESKSLNDTIEFLYLQYRAYRSPPEEKAAAQADFDRWLNQLSEIQRMAIRHVGNPESGISKTFLLDEAGKLVKE